MEDRVTLCGANSYEEKYYFNKDFDLLPDDVKKTLHASCVLFTEEVGGIITLDFDKEGNLLVNISSDERDFYYDEIEAELQVRRFIKNGEELFAKLELYYKAKLTGNFDIKGEDE